MTALLKILAQGICMRARDTFCNNGNVMSVSRIHCLTVPPLVGLCTNPTGDMQYSVYNT